MSSYKITFRILFLFSFGIALAVPVNALDVKSKFDPFVQPMIEDKLVVGLVVGVYRNGERQIIGYGETKQGSGNIPNSKTVYEIGSITKTFTGTVLADMVNNREVKLTDPVNDYLPNDGKLKDSTHPITLLDLAMHTSGLPYIPDGEPTDMKNPYADFTFDALNTFLNNHQLKRLPGQYEYSNVGMGVLGNALAQKTGTTYEKLVIARICNPLDMTDTRITLTDEMKSRMATPYDANLTETKNWDLPSVAGAGAFRSTCDDMLSFAVASMNYQAKPLGAAFALAHQKQFSSPNSPSVGLAWHIAKDDISRWHNGGTGGYASMMVVIPDSGIAVVVLSNTGAYNQITTLGEQLAAIVAGKNLTPPILRQQVSVDPAVLQSYVGVYSFNPVVALTITYENGSLKAQMTGQDAYPLSPESESKFFFKVVDAQVSFVKDSAGQVEKLILHQNGIDQNALRKKEE